MIEHTLLGDNIDEARLSAHVEEAVALDVLGVCVPLAFVPLAKKLMANTNKIVVTVIDFPKGQKSSVKKAEEALLAKELGADEIDMVLDYQALMDKNYAKALSDITAVIEAACSLPIKVIVETSALNREQLAIACALVVLSGAQYIKTSTGFHKSGATVSDVAFMRSLLPENVLIKASGGIRDLKTVQALIDAGASRIGTSKSKEILPCY